jgi:circadian clock protein KaiB
MMADPETPYVLKLFVTTWSTASHRAVRNVTALLRECYPAQYRLEIVDITVNPMIAIAENVIMTPLLVKEAPEPSRRFMGDMSDRIKLMAGLNLKSS